MRNEVRIEDVKIGDVLLTPFYIDENLQPVRVTAIDGSLIGYESLDGRHTGWRNDWQFEYRPGEER